MLSTQHALITGGSRGIGFKVAEKLSEQGCKVTLISRSAPKLTESVNYLNTNYPLSNGKLHQYISCDLADTAHLSDRIISHFEDYKTVNILVNCAGQTQTSFLVNTPDATIDSIFKTNLVAPTILCRLFARTMLRQKVANGNIINISSMLADEYLPGTVVYSASKAALNKVSINLSREMNRRGVQTVRVNSILPGLIRETEMGNSVSVEKMTELGLGGMTTTMESVAMLVLGLVADGKSSGRVIRLPARESNNDDILTE